MESIWAAALVLVACSDPARIGALQEAMLCGGYVESESGPYHYTDPSACFSVRPLTPVGAVLTVESAMACDVEREGATCLVLGPGEGFRAWTPVEQSARHVEWYWEPVTCDASCS